MSITASLVLNGLHMYLLYSVWMCVCVHALVCVCVSTRVHGSARFPALRTTSVVEMRKLK